MCTIVYSKSIYADTLAVLVFFHFSRYIKSMKITHLQKLGFALFAVALAFSTLTCELQDVFAAYRGVNLLPTDARTFTFPIIPTSPWQPYVYDPIVDAIDPLYENLGQELAASGRSHLLVFEDPALGAGYEDAARLEMPNLMPSGDFEAGLDAGWNPGGFTGTFAAQTAVAAGAGNQINQNVLRIISSASTDTGNFALSGLNGGLPADGAELFLRASLRGDVIDGVFFQLHNNTDTAGLQNLLASGLVATTAALEFPADYHEGITDPEADIRSQFTIGDSLDPTPTLCLPAGQLEEEGTIIDGSIDNLRIGRADVRSHIRTLVPAESPDGLELVSGTYKLRFEVRRDPGADLDDAGKDANRFPAPAIAAELFPVGSNSGLTGQGYELSWAALASWTEITFTFENIQIPAGLTATDDALEIRIYANDPTSYEHTSDIGSILIRNPSLVFDP